MPCPVRGRPRGMRCRQTMGAGWRRCQCGAEGALCVATVTARSALVAMGTARPGPKSRVLRRPRTPGIARRDRGGGAGAGEACAASPVRWGQSGAPGLRAGGERRDEGLRCERGSGRAGGGGTHRAERRPREVPTQRYRQRARRSRCRRRLGGARDGRGQSVGVV